MQADARSSCKKILKVFFDVLMVPDGICAIPFYTSIYICHGSIEILGIDGIQKAIHTGVDLRTQRITAITVSATSAATADQADGQHNQKKADEPDRCKPNRKKSAPGRRCRRPGGRASSVGHLRPCRRSPSGASCGGRPRGSSRGPGRDTCADRIRPDSRRTPCGWRRSSRCEDRCLR